MAHLITEDANRNVNITTAKAPIIKIFSKRYPISTRSGTGCLSSCILESSPSVACHTFHFLADDHIDGSCCHHQCCHQNSSGNPVACVYATCRNIFCSICYGNTLVTIHCSCLLIILDIVSFGAVACLLDFICCLRWDSNNLYSFIIL